jgi:choline dehydrogenase-like flavoprotein
MIDARMELDARKIFDGASLEADLCIVGAGPAGIALAREFIGEKVRVLLLESGGPEPEEPIQELNEGAAIGDPYAGLRATRCRAVGGAAHLWNTPVDGAAGAKYAPFDPCDFSQRSELPLSGWPFDHSYLRPFYVRAQALCGLGPFAYEGEEWPDEKRPCFTLDGERLTTRVYQFGPGSVFTRAHPRAVSGSDNVALCHHATVCGLELTSSGRQVSAAKCSSLSGRRFRVRAKIFVFAAGAVETARLLLLSGGGADALGNRHGWVGRCFMEHLRDYALILVPRSPELFARAAFYDAHAERDTMVGGRIALTEQAIRREKLPNASITLLPRFKIWPAPASAAGRWATRLRRLAGYNANMGYGWSREPKLERKCDAFQLLVNFEQQPNPENKVVLAAKMDFLGVPQVELHWRWRGEEQEQLERLRAVLASELEAANLGRVEIRAGMKPDPNAHHHAGTTRMHADPRHGVVDADGRVHGTDNLYVAGSSVFATAGFANPTLTIVALALRLADHLRGRI